MVLKLIEFDKLVVGNDEPRRQNMTLHVLANMPSAFQSGYPMKFFDSIIYNRKNPPSN